MVPPNATPSIAPWVTNTPPRLPRLARGLVVVGASAGGVEPLVELVAGLPADLDACVLVVLHVPASGSSALPLILRREGVLPARHARDGEPLEPGQVLIAPPDRHLVVADDAVHLSYGPQQNGHRPSIDVLFRSAAREWGERVLGVVLSGSLDDGAAGVGSIRAGGGQCVAQSDAMFPGMPAAAATSDDPQPVPAREMAEHVSSWLSGVAGVTGLSGSTDATATPTPAGGPPGDSETAWEEGGEPPDTFGCPDCGGSLYPVASRNHHFRCRVGHAWSPSSLLARQDAALESALWMALRSLEEKAVLQERMRTRAAGRGQERTAALLELGAREAGEAAHLVRQLMTELGEVRYGDPRRRDQPRGETEG